jgi:hypothetical protein
MPITTPITGQSYVIANQSATLTNATAGGSWSSSDITIATIDIFSGIVKGIKSGNVVITYTKGGDIATFALNISPYNITNGFNTQLVLSNSANRITWSSEGDSDSGRHWEDFHALCNENLIQNLFPTINPTSPQYASTLSSLKRSVTLDALNSIFNGQQLIDKINLIYNRSDWRLYLQQVANQGQFVGITFGVAAGDFAVAFRNLVLFFDKAITFNLYLYNDMIDGAIASFPVSVLAYSQTTIPVVGSELLILNYLTPLNIKGGRWFLGYYQKDIDDLGAHALFYNICYTRFKVIQPFAFSAPVIPSPVDGTRNFSRINVGQNNLMYGMNAEVCTYVDPTNDIIQNMQGGLFDNLLGLLMASKIIENIIFSYRNNKVQVNIMGNEMLDKLYLELNASESSNPSELNFTNGLRKRIEDAKRVVKKGFQNRSNLVAGCG